MKNPRTVRMAMDADIAKTLSAEFLDMTLDEYERRYCEGMETGSKFWEGMPHPPDWQAGGSKAGWESHVENVYDAVLSKHKETNQ